MLGSVYEHRSPLLLSSLSSLNLSQRAEPESISLVHGGDDPGKPSASKAAPWYGSNLPMPASFLAWGFGSRISCAINRGLWLVCLVLGSDLMKNPVDGFSAGLVDDSNVFEWNVTIIGPPDTL